MCIGVGVAYYRINIIIVLVQGGVLARSIVQSIGFYWKFN